MNICQRLLSDYNLNRLYNSYIIETDDASQALSEVGDFLIKSIFEREGVFIGDTNINTDLRSDFSDQHLNHLYNFPDFFLVKKEDIKSKNISIDQIHELQKFLNKSSVISGFKVGVIFESDLMNEKSENACLKMLEDTPKHSLIILITTNATSILPTIKSRCAKICFKSQPSNYLIIDSLHLNALKKNIEVKDRIDFMQTFLSKDRKKWLEFAKDTQKLVIKFLKHLLSPKDYSLSELEQDIFKQLKYRELYYFEYKYDKISELIDYTTKLDLDLRVSTIMLINLLKY